MATDRYELQRWEIAASAGATLALTINAILQEDFKGLIQTVQALHNAVPGWLQFLIRVPMPVWWIGTGLVGVGVFFLGLNLARRHGMPWLFLAPAVMLVLPYVLQWILFAPIRAATLSRPGGGGELP